MVLQKKVLFGYKHYHYNDHVSMDLSEKTSMERFFDRVVQNAEWYHHTGNVRENEVGTPSTDATMR